MNSDNIESLLEDIRYLYGEENGFLTDDLYERYEKGEDYDNYDEFMAEWIADLLAFEYIMDLLHFPFDFDKAFSLGIYYLEQFKDIFDITGWLNA